MKGTEDYGDVLRLIEAFRHRLERIRPWDDMMA